MICRLLLGALAVLGLLTSPACAGLTGSSKSADERLAEALVPQASDLGSGWRRLSDDAPRSDKCVSDTTGLTRTASDGAGNHAVAFRDTPANQLFAKSETFRTTAQAKTAFRRGTATAITHCLSQTAYDGARLAPNSAALGILVGAPSTKALALPVAGDESRVYEISIPVDSTKSTFTLYVDYAVIRVRRGVGSILAIRVWQPFDSALLESLMTKMAERDTRA